MAFAYNSLLLLVLLAAVPALAAAPAKQSVRSLSSTCNISSISLTDTLHQIITTGAIVSCSTHDALHVKDVTYTNCTVNATSAGNSTTIATHASSACSITDPSNHTTTHVSSDCTELFNISRLLKHASISIDGTSHCSLNSSAANNLTESSSLQVTTHCTTTPTASSTNATFTTNATSTSCLAVYILRTGPPATTIEYVDALNCTTLAFTPTGNHTSLISTQAFESCSIDTTILTPTAKNPTFHFPSRS